MSNTNTNFFLFFPLSFLSIFFLLYLLSSFLSTVMVLMVVIASEQVSRFQGMILFNYKFTKVTLLPFVSLFFFSSSSFLVSSSPFSRFSPPFVSFRVGLTLSLTDTDNKR